MRAEHVEGEIVRDETGKATAILFSTSTQSTVATESYACQGPSCGKPVPPQRKRHGESKRFCSDACRRAAWELAHPRLGTQRALDFKPPLAGPPAHFGKTFSEPLDGERLKTLRGRIERLLVDGRWYTLQEIQAVTGGSLTGVSAKLRDLRKKQFGGYPERIMRRRRKGLEKQGVHEYRMR